MPSPPMKYIAFISAVLCIFLLPCCRSSGNSGAVVTVWAAMSSDQIRALADIADRYERETGTSVRIVEIGLFEITTKLELAAPAGKGPDVVSISHTSVGTLALMGLLAPMDRFSGLLARYPRPFIEAYRYGGVLLGVPLTVESYGLVINEKLVGAVPKSWEELFDEAARLTRDTNGDSTPDVYGFLTDPTNFYFTFPFYDARGAYIFRDRGASGNDTTDLGFCTPGGIQALTLLTDLTLRRHLIPRGITYPVITDLFSRGRLAMTIYGTYLISSWQKLGLEVGYHELPPFADGSRGRPLSTLMGLGISAYADHPRQAEQFITYLLLPENLRRFFELSGKQSGDGRPRGLSGRGLRAHALPSHRAVGRVGLLPLPQRSGGRPRVGRDLGRGGRRPQRRRRRRKRPCATCRIGWRPSSGR